MADSPQLQDADPSAAGGHPDLILWTEPLDWLEELLPGSPIIANLRRSLSRPVNTQIPIVLTSSDIWLSDCTEVDPEMQSANDAVATLLSVEGTTISSMVHSPNISEFGANCATGAKVSGFQRERCTSTPLSSPNALGFGSSTAGNNPDESTTVGIGSFTAGNNPDKSAAVGIGSLTAGNNPDESTAVGIGSFTAGNNPDESTAVGIGSFTAGNNPDESTAVGIGSFTAGNNPDESTAVGIGSFTAGNNPDESTAVGIGSFTAGNNPNESTAVGIGSFTTGNNPDESTAVGIGSFTAGNNPDESTAVGIGNFTVGNNPDNSNTTGIRTSKEDNNANAFAVTTKVSENSIKEGVASFLGEDKNPSTILSPDEGLNSTESVASASVLPAQGECSGTAISVLSYMTTPSISDSGVGAHTCPRDNPITASLGCECHGAWASPLSLLDTTEGIAFDFRPATHWNITKDCTTPPNLPVSRQNMAVGTAITPVCVASVTTWTSPPALVGVAVNTSPVEKAATKDNVAETDSLLWRCPRDQWRALSRSELEARLESTLIILEALSHQIGAFRDRQACGAAPSEQRDAGSQTLLSDPTEEERAYRDVNQELLRQNKALRHNRESDQEVSQRMASTVAEMKEWMLNSGQLLDTVDASYLRVQEDRKSLVLQQKQLGELLLKCRGKLQRSSQKQAEMKSEMEKALQIKEAAELTLEAVRSHAALRIESLMQNFNSQNRIRWLLKEANECKAGLLLENKENMEEMDRRTTTLRESWIQMQNDYQTLTNMAAHCRSDREKMVAEVTAAREEVAQHREVCRKLEERTAEVEQALGCISELTQANAILERDLVSALQRANVAQREKEEACQEKEGLSEQLAAEQDATRALREEAARLTLEKEAMQWERESANREARESTECREFIEEENEIMRRHQAETEAALKSALAALREQGAQMEDLKGAHQTLQDERDALRAELVASEAKARSTGAILEALSKSLWDMKGVHLQMLEMADLEETSINRTPAPRQHGSSFVDSILQAAAGRESRTPGLLSESTAFAKAIPVRSSEIQEDFSCCVQDFRGAAAQIRQLISSRNEEIRNLKAEVLQLKQSLEGAEKRLQEEKEAADTNASKLSKALHQHMENEKEMQALMWKQEKRFLQLSDQSWEISTLQEEVSQLKVALQKAERESAALWEELDRTRKPSEEDALREKIWLRDEVEKLREILLRKDGEQKEILARSAYQMRSLEAQLLQARKMQRKHEQTQAEIKAALSASPPDVDQACRLLEPDA